MVPDGWPAASVTVTLYVSDGGCETCPDHVPLKAAGMTDPWLTVGGAPDAPRLGPGWPVCAAALAAELPPCARCMIKMTIRTTPTAATPAMTQGSARRRPDRRGPPGPRRAGPGEPDAALPPVCRALAEACEARNGCDTGPG